MDYEVVHLEGKSVMTHNTENNMETASTQLTAKENFDQTENRDHRIGVVGDWHGETSWGMDAINTLADSGVHTIFHVGDFGFWGDEQGRGYLRKLQRVLGARNSFIYVTLGNHEDYNFIEKVYKPLDGMDGCFIYDQHPNIVILGRGFRWNWKGHRWISLGGAHSIDRYQRKPNKNWWKQESISDEDVAKSVIGGRADMMIAHDVPYGVDMFGSHHETMSDWTKAELDYAVISRLQLRKVTDIVQPVRYVHGHYHMKKNHYFKFSSQAGYELSVNGEVSEVDNNSICEEYVTNYICLDKEYSNDNFGFIDLETLEFSNYSSFG